MASTLLLMGLGLSLLQCDLHTEEGTNALFGWLEGDPHLDTLGGVVDKATALRICMGMGIVLGDVSLIQSAGTTFDGSVPDHIVNSPWGSNEYEKCQNYLCKMRYDLVKEAEAVEDVSNTELPRYVGCNMQRVSSLIELYNSQNKKKASGSKPPRKKARAQKDATPLQTNSSDEPDESGKGADAESETMYGFSDWMESALNQLTIFQNPKVDS